MNKKQSVAKIIVFLIMMIFGATAFAQSKTHFEQKLNWRAEENASEYKVEVRPVSGGNSTFYNTDQTYVVLTLSAGDYQYRVYAYDFLGRESSVSEWQKFSVLKAVAPVISAPQKVETEVKKGDKVSVPVEVKNIEKDSKVELINKKTNQVVQGTLETVTTGTTVAAASAVFPKVAEGQWTVKVTNPSGLSTESTVIEIEDKASAELERKRLEKERLEEEKRLAEERRLEEEKRLAEEKQLAQQQKQQEAAEKKEMAAAKKQQEEEQRQLADAEKKRLADEKRLAEEERKRLEKEQKEADEAEKRRLAEEKKLAEEAEKKRLAEEKQRQMEEAARQREEELARKEAEKKERERIAQEKKEAAKKEAAERRAERLERAKAVEEQHQENVTVLEKQWAKEAAEREAVAKKAEEERLAKEKKAEEIRIAKEKKAEAERKKKEWAEYWKNKNYLDLNVQAGGGAVINLYDGQLFNYSKQDYMPAVKADVSYLPFNLGKIKLGAEVNGLISYLNSETTYINYTIPYGLFNVDAVVHLPLFKDRLFVGAKAGAGISILNVQLVYDEKYARKQNAASYYGFITVNGGLNLYWLVTRVISVEAGADFTHIFINNMPTGIISPYLSIGVRF